MTEPRKQADPARVVCDWLAEHIDVPCRMSVPSKWIATDGPILVVVNEGGTGNLSPVATRVRVGLTAYASGRTEARGIAARAVGLLASTGGPESVHVGRDVAGVIVGRDRATGAWTASTAVTVVARTTTTDKGNGR